MTASTPLLITFGIYLLAMLGIGFVAWKRTRDFDDYILGGRSLGGYVTAKDGEQLAFSFIYNGRDLWRARAAIDAMGVTLASFSR